MKMTNIQKNATIIYESGEQETFDQIKITETGVIIGRIIKSYPQSSDHCSEEIVYCGFIPHSAIKEIKHIRK